MSARPKRKLLRRGGDTKQPAPVAQIRERYREKLKLCAEQGITDATVDTREEKALLDSYDALLKALIAVREADFVDTPVKERLRAGHLAEAAIKEATK